jgi:hypothetical protein
MKARLIAAFCLVVVLILLWLGGVLATASDALPLIPAEAASSAQCSSHSIQSYAVCKKKPVPTPTPTPTSANLALGRPVTVSSVAGSGLEGEKAVDGDLETRWASAASDPQWIYVEPRLSLMGPPIVNTVVLNWAAAYGSAYQIQVSDDALNWITVHVETAGDGGMDNITGLQATGRYVRMYGAQRGSAPGYSLYEFELYGVDAPAGDLGWRKVGGVVYADELAPGHELAGALVACSQFSYFPRDGSCSPYQITTGADGAFAFDVFVHDTDRITASAQRVGYKSASGSITGFDCVGSCPPINLVLASLTPTPTPPPPPE